MSQPTSTPPIEHDRAQQRFFTVVDNAVCELDYTVRDSTDAPGGKQLTITHTLVPEAVGGRGIAAALVRAAMEHVREQRWTVVPACSYAATWLQRHCEYADLKGG